MTSQDLFDVGGRARLSSMNSNVEAQPLCLLESFQVLWLKGEEFIPCNVHSNHAPVPIPPGKLDDVLAVF